MDFEHIAPIAAGAFLAIVAGWCIAFWRRAENQRAQQEAEAVLARHGLSAHLYMPGIGVDDPVLHHALDRVAFSGRIVVDQSGRVIGKLMPKVVKGPHLRLVVDNAK